MPHVVFVGYTGQVATELRCMQLPAGWVSTSVGQSQLGLANLDQVWNLLRQHRPDVLINAAAFTAVDEAEDKQHLAMQMNAEMPAELAKFASAQNIPFLHISSGHVFDGIGGMPWSEGDEKIPINVFGRSMLAGEYAVLKSDARSVILRTSWVFSPYGNNFVKTMLRLGKERERLSIVADQHGGPTPASEIASTLIKIAQKLVDPASSDDHLGVYHFSGTPRTTWADFAEAIFEQADWLDRKPEIIRISMKDRPMPAARPRYSVLNCSKIERDYGIEQPDWHEGLARTLEQLRPQVVQSK